MGGDTSAVKKKHDCNPMADKSKWKTPSMEREGRWTPIRAKAQDTRANHNSWETHLVRKRWDIGLLRALSPRIMMMMNICFNIMLLCFWLSELSLGGSS